MIRVGGKSMPGIPPLCKYVHCVPHPTPRATGSTPDLLISYQCSWYNLIVTPRILPYERIPQHAICAGCIWRGKQSTPTMTSGPPGPSACHIFHVPALSRPWRSIDVELPVPVTSETKQKTKCTTSQRPWDEPLNWPWDISLIPISSKIWTPSNVGLGPCHLDPWPCLHTRHTATLFFWSLGLSLYPESHSSTNIYVVEFIF